MTKHYRDNLKEVEERFPGLKKAESRKVSDMAYNATRRPGQMHLDTIKKRERAKRFK